MRAVAVLGLLSFCLFGVAAEAQAPSQPIVVDIPASPLNDALKQLARLAGLQVVFYSKDSEGLTARRLEGEYTADAALKQLLEGTGLVYEYVNPHTIAIRDKAPAIKPTASLLSAESIRLAQSDSAVPDTAVPRPEAGMALDEVIVTATKRAERLQDVPVSIAVIGGQDIERRGLIGMEDYLRSIPGVNQIDNGALSNAIVIRGITTSPLFENIGSGTTVATFFGETSVTGAAGLGQAGIDIRPVDLERIEILRGPQGTTYGSASLAGAMRMILARPRLDSFGGKLAASYSDTSGAGSDNSMIQAVVNLPLVTDKFALRAVGYRYDDSGYYRNIAGIDPATLAHAADLGLSDYIRGYTQKDVGRMVTHGGRLSGLWQAADNFDLTLNLLTQKIEQDGFPSEDGTPLETVGKYRQTQFPVAPAGRARDEESEIYDTDLDLANLVANYDIRWGKLTSAISWVKGGSENASTIAFDDGSSSTSPSAFKSRTYEARLASQLEGSFQFLGGLFYEHTKNDYLYLFDTVQASTAVGIYGQTRDLTQRAVFGDISYALSQQLTATVGGRYFKYRKDESTVLDGAYGDGVPVNLKNSEDGTSFKANLSYKPTPDALIYASWAEGFRLGRPDIGALADFCDLDPVDGIIDGTGVTLGSTRTIKSDNLENYELGAKLSVLDRRLVLDGAVYHIRWSGLPIRTVTAGNCGFTSNAGSATSNGVELQASLFLSPGVRIEIGTGYTKAELSEDAPAQGWQDGDRLPGSPRINANLAAQYEFQVAGHKAFVRADSFYTGKFYGDLQQSANVSAGDYVKIDARAGLAVRGMSFELFVRNLTNEDAFTWRSNFYSHRLRPRTVGVQIGYSFE